MYCKKCGKELGVDSKFCNNCGSPAGESMNVCEQMSLENLIEYLRRVCAVENQKIAFNKANSEIRNRIVYLGNPQKITKPEKEWYTKPKFLYINPQKYVRYDEFYIWFSVVVFIIFAILLVCLAANGNNSALFYATIISASIILLIGGARSIDKRYRFKKDYKQYKVFKEKDDARCSYEIQVKNNLLAQSSDMQKGVDESDEALLEAYSCNIIFPKYRNAVAMNTILEYFESGRVTTLTGKDGAYNLYESELRQNIIIGKLDVIINQLEQIKQNQYLMYQVLCEANNIAHEILNEAYETSRNLSNINSAIEKQNQLIKMNNDSLLSFLVF